MSTKIPKETTFLWDDGSYAVARQDNETFAQDFCEMVWLKGLPTSFRETEWVTETIPTQSSYCCSKTCTWIEYIDRCSLYEEDLYYNADLKMMVRCDKCLKENPTKEIADLREEE